jgi:hypothetical protein
VRALTDQKPTILANEEHGHAGKQQTDPRRRDPAPQSVLVSDTSSEISPGSPGWAYSGLSAFLP